MSGCIVYRLERVFLVGGFRVVCSLHCNALVSFAVVLVYIYVKRLRLLPGVKTLFRDSEEAYPWCL